MRHMMVAVAVVAVCLSATLAYQRHAKYRRMFLAYEHESRFIRDTILLNERRLDVLRRRGVLDSKEAAEAASIPEVLPQVRRAAQEAERQRLRYEWAIWHPWSRLEAAPSYPPDGRQ
jgi:hypothetical protein